MKDGDDKGVGQSAAPKKDTRRNPRNDRLKLALRENLKRRKSQARGRDDVVVAPSNADDASPHDDGDKPVE